MVVYNRTHVHWQQIQTQKDTEANRNAYGQLIVDDALYVFDKHGSFAEHDEYWNGIQKGNGDPIMCLTKDNVLELEFAADAAPSAHYSQFQGFKSAVDCVTGVCH